MRSMQLSLAAIAAVVALAEPALADADAVTDWNAIAQTAIVATGGQSPQAAAPSFAMVQGAVYDAVNAIDGRYRPYLALPNANPWDSEAAATAAAAYNVLRALFPAQAGALQTTYNTYVAGLPDSPTGSKAAGIAVGEAIRSTRRPGSAACARSSSP